MKPIFNLLTESDGEGKEREGKERRDEELQEFSAYNIVSTLEIILLGLFFLNVGTSFGPAKPGIQSLR